MTRAAPRGITRYRMLAIAALGVVAVLAGMLLFGNLNSNLVYYLTPAEAVAQRAAYPDGRRFQLGGLVVDGSLSPTADGVRFVVTSGTGPGSTTIPVNFKRRAGPAVRRRHRSGAGGLLARERVRLGHDEGQARRELPAPGR